jgi:hypothetical protein
VIYEGTEEQIEAKLWELLQEQKAPVSQKIQAKPKQKKPVVLKAASPAPTQIHLPRYQQLLADTYRHEDKFQAALLKAMLKRWQDDEDDIEVLMLLH